MTISVGFKEWAGICAALASGRQTLILRKGGIAESDGEFKPEHESFLLFPTYFHEPIQGLAEAEAIPEPRSDIVRISHWCHVCLVVANRRFEEATRLAPFHVWTQETIERRFHYRSPGLFALFVRVYALPRPIELPNDPSYAGCKSWVPLLTAVDTDGSKPVMNDDDYNERFNALTAIVNASN